MNKPYVQVCNVDWIHSTCVMICNISSMMQTKRILSDFKTKKRTWGMVWVFAWRYLPLATFAILGPSNLSWNRRPILKIPSSTDEANKEWWSYKYINISFIWVRESHFLLTFYKLCEKCRRSNSFLNFQSKNWINNARTAGMIWR